MNYLVKSKFYWSLVQHLVIWLLCLAPGFSPELQAKERKPNFLLIMADDLGFSDLGCYGSEISTPNLDALAREGFQSRRFYNAARCCPSRAALLTGRFPHEAGMGAMVSPPNRLPGPGPYQGYLNREIPTLAEVMHLGGYQTLMTGKWHVGEARQDWPCQRGFDKYFGLVSGASSYYEVLPNRLMLRQNEIFTPTSGFYATDAYADTLLGWIRETEKPFFAYLAFTAPHWPLHAPEVDVARYRNLYRKGWDTLRRGRLAKQKALGLVPQGLPSESLSPLPPWEKVKEQQKEAEKMAVYAAMVEKMDAAIGRIIQYLKTSNRFENTMVIFLSDNGGCAENLQGRTHWDGLDTALVARLPPGPKGSYMAYGKDWATLSNTPFRSHKSTIYEGGIASPFICKPLPGMGKDNPFEGKFITDVFPEFLKLAGIPLPEQWNGHVLTPFPSLGETRYGWEHFGNRGYRKGNWKLVALKGKEWELYHLESDPTESQNRASTDPAVLNDLESLWLKWARKVGAKVE